MRLPRKTSRTIHYKTYTGKTQIVVDGRKTGEYTLTYSTLSSLVADVSVAKGEADLSIFGVNTQYSRVVITDDMTCPINEESIVWVDAPTSGRNDYVVVKVAKSYGFIAYALLEVK